MIARPPAIAVAAHVAAAPMPRMTATLVAAHGRSAIFVAPSAASHWCWTRAGVSAPERCTRLAPARRCCTDRAGCRSSASATMAPAGPRTTALPPPVLESGTRCRPTGPTRCVVPLPSRTAAETSKRGLILDPLGPQAPNPISYYQRVLIRIPYSAPRRLPAAGSIDLRQASPLIARPGIVEGIHHCAPLYVCI